MSYLAPQNLFFSALMICLGLLLGWFIWGKLKRKLIAVEKSSQTRIYDLGIDLQTRRNRIEELEDELKTKVDRITYLDRAIIGLRTSYNNVNSSRDDIQGKLDTAVDHCSDQDEEQLTLLVDLQNKTEEINELKALLGKTTEKNNTLNTELQNRIEEVSLLREKIPVIYELQSQLDSAIEITQSLKADANRQNEQIKYLKAKLADSDELKTQLENAKERINTLGKELDGQRTKLFARNKEFECQVVAFTNLQNEYKNRDNKQRELETNLQTTLDKIAPLEKQISELNTLQTNISQRDEQIAQLEKTIQAGNARIRPLQSELEKAHFLELELRDKLEASSQKTAAIEDKLNTRNSTIASLEGEIDSMQKFFAPLEETIKQRDERITVLEQELTQTKQQILPLREHIHAREDRIQALEKQLQDATKVVSINSHALNNHKAETPTEKSIEKAKSNEKAIEKLAEKTTLANNQKPSKLSSYGLKKPNGKADDLKLISGVGVKLEQVLNKCGIFHFEQIVNFKRKDVAAVDDMLNFKGRIDRDEWIKQARLLMRGVNTATEKTKPKATRKSSTTHSRVKPLGMKRPKGELDDLQLITGVGPKLERKLHRLGVYHFEQIAEFTREDIELLDRKLGTYRGRVKRDRWPTQAKRLHREFYA